MNSAPSISSSSSFSGLSGFNKLSVIFFPTLLMILMETINQFTEKVFLGYVSAEAITIRVNVHYFMRMFLIPALVFIPLTQAHIGQLLGLGEHSRIGKTVWQVIWFAFMLTFLVLLLGYPLGNLYFKQMPLAKETLPFFFFYIAIYLFFPIKAIFVGFYFGIGKVKWMAILISLVHFFHIGLNYVLIPYFGLMGAAFNCLIIHLFVCIFLFTRFLFSKKTQQFSTRFSPFQPKLMFLLMKPGLSRILSQFTGVTVWVFVSYIMNQLSLQHASILAIGTTLYFIFYCISQAMMISMVNLNAPLVAMHSYESIKRMLSTGLFFILLWSIPIGFFLLLFPEWTFAQLFPKIPLEPSEVRIVFYALWLAFFVCSTIGACSGVVFAFKKTIPFIVTGLWLIFADFGGVAFLGMKLLNISPMHFWTFTTLTTACIFLYYFMLVRFSCKKGIETSRRYQKGLA